MHPVLLNRRLGKLPSWSALFGEKKILSLLPVIEPRIHSCPASSLGIIAANLF
jgi:hypothetical protein